MNKIINKLLSGFGYECGCRSLSIASSTLVAAATAYLIVRLTIWLPSFLTAIVGLLMLGVLALVMLAAVLGMTWKDFKQIVKI